MSQARSVTYNIKSDGSVIVNVTPTAGGPSYIVLYLDNDEVHADDYCDSNHVLYGCPSGGSESTYCMYVAKGSYVNYDTGSGTILWSTEQTSILVVIRISDGYTANNLVFKPAIIDKALWDSGFTTPIVKTLPNFTLTPALIEQVDSGAKNLLKAKNGSTTSVGVTFTLNSDGSITANGTATGQDAVYTIEDSLALKSDQAYWLSTGVTGASASTYFIDTYHDSWTNRVVYYIGGELSTKVVRVRIIIASGTTVNNVTFRPMICTKTDWNVSQTFVPYRPSYDELMPKGNRIVATGSSSFTIEGTTHLVCICVQITANSFEYANYIMIKYTSANNVNLALLSKSTNADTYITVTTSGDTVTVDTSDKWKLVTINKLT